MTAVPPAEARRGFASIDGAWVASLTARPAPREQLLAVAFARNAATEMGDKMEALYRYLSGDAFRHRVETSLEAFTALCERLDRKRRATERIWTERERQIDRVVGATAGPCGEAQGTIRQSIPSIAALELDDDQPLLGGLA